MDDQSIRRVAILGAGVMGSSLATLLTNYGFSVTLIDRTAQRASEGLDRVRNTLTIPERINEIRISGLEDGLRGIALADWVVEAVSENRTEKAEAYRLIAGTLGPNAIVTTSGGSLAVSELAVDLPEGIRKRFFACHFALPLRDRRLVELRAGPETDPAVFAEFRDFVSHYVARDVLVSPDGPGDLISRYGLWTLFLQIHAGLSLRLGIEDVDMISGPLFGHPRTGTFELADRIGLANLREVSQNLLAAHPTDRGTRFFQLPDCIPAMLGRGWGGHPDGKGFYRREGRDHMVLDLLTMAYRPPRDPDLPGLGGHMDKTLIERLKDQLSSRGEVGEYLRQTVVPSLQYAEVLREKLGRPGYEFDRIMQEAFGWELGPFRLTDALDLGPTRHYQGETYREVDGSYAPIPTQTGCQYLEACPVLESYSGISVLDLGDGVMGIHLEDTALAPTTLLELAEVLRRPFEKPFVLIIEMDRDDIFPSAWVILDQIETRSLPEYLNLLHAVEHSLSQKPFVAAVRRAVHGPLLGLIQSSGIIIADERTHFGFSEAKAGLLPYAGVLARLRARYATQPKKLAELTALLVEGYVAPNPDLAKPAGWLRPSDQIVAHPGRWLTTAKQLSAQVVPIGAPSFEELEGPVAGMIDRELDVRRGRGLLSEHDVAIGQRIRHILTKATDGVDLAEREKAEILELSTKALSLARLRHLRDSGKPLRN